MKQKYNAALTPQTQGPTVIALAQQFSTITHQYLLGPHSLPHLTLQQFYAEESQIENLWTQLCTALPQKTIELEFKKFSGVTFNNEIYWISLVPDQIDLLNQMHATVLRTLNETAPRPFDPHMTLTNTKETDTQKQINKYCPIYHPIKDLFRLSLGHCDEHGQVTEIIYAAP